jgi:hypothetical protein
VYSTRRLRQADRSGPPGPLNAASPDSRPSKGGIAALLEPSVDGPPPDLVPDSPVGQARGSGGGGDGRFVGHKFEGRSHEPVFQDGYPYACHRECNRGTPCGVASAMSAIGPETGTSAPPRRRPQSSIRSRG